MPLDKETEFTETLKCVVEKLGLQHTVAEHLAAIEKEQNDAEARRNDAGTLDTANPPDISRHPGESLEDWEKRISPPKYSGGYSY